MNSASTRTIEMAIPAGVLQDVLNTALENYYRQMGVVKNSENIEDIKVELQGTFPVKIKFKPKEVEYTRS